MMSARRYLIAANWKMHKTLTEARTLAREVLRGLTWGLKAEVALAPPFTALAPVAEEVAGSDIRLAGQDCFWERQGAYTGAISPVMLQDLGCHYVIIGHSERRQVFGDTDLDVNRKLRASLDAGLCPICCIGETLEERQSGQTLARVGTQLEEGLKDLGPLTGAQLVLAYEPVWAIGTGLTATPAQAQEVHAFIRSRLRELLGAAAEDVRLLYGGSVTPDNAASLLAEADIDGALVGGASLKAPSFLGIITAAG
jgi:triosephosphate isomerase (TIM)